MSSMGRERFLRTVKKLEILSYSIFILMFEIGNRLRIFRKFNKMTSADSLITIWYELCSISRFCY